VLSGCAPTSPDHHYWTDQATQALGDAVSDVSTARLALQLQQRGDLQQNYQQVVVLDSEKAVGTTLQAFGGLQPPPRDTAAYHRVTKVLSDASDLLSEVRIAVVREDTGRYAELLDDLAQVRADLLKAQEQLS
jgi:hypothetical protein